MTERVKHSYDFPRFFEAIANTPDMPESVASSFRNLVRELEKLHREFALVGNITIGDVEWIAVGSFLNSWVSAGSTTPSYMKTSSDFVELKGVIDTGSVGSSAFLLPEGYRPVEQLQLACISNGALGRVNILTNGNVVPASPSNNASVSLDGLRFRADAI